VTWPSRRLLSAALVLAIHAAGGPAAGQTRFDGEGRVVAVDEARGIVTLDHGPIQDVFPAGRTEFPVPDPAVLRQVRVGDTVGFSVRVSEADGRLALSTLVARRPVPPLAPSVPARRIEDFLVWVSVLVWTAALALAVWLQGRRQQRAMDQVTREVRALATRAARTADDVEAVATVLGQMVEALRDGWAPAIRRRAEAAQALVRGADATGDGDPRHVVVVRRGNIALFRALQDRLQAAGTIPVVWDRRLRERRGDAAAHVPERRHADRRAAPQPSWTALGFALARGAEARQRAGASPDTAA
jgi:Cu/Ag efflux protein CusF